MLGFFYNLLSDNNDFFHIKVLIVFDIFTSLAQNYNPFSYVKNIINLETEDS